MATVSVTLPSDGQTIDASDVNTPINTIVNEINGSLDADNIADGSITNAKLDTTAGELGGAWTTWTPNWTNLGTGNGTLNYAKYTQIGKTVHMKLQFTLGSTSSVTSTPIGFSPPVNISSDENGAMNGMVTYFNSGDNNYFGSAARGSATLINLASMAQDSGGTYIDQGTTDTAIPFTWSTGDVIYVALTYEAA